jgi:type I restriction enzyme S subunit
MKRPKLGSLDSLYKAKEMNIQTGPFGTQLKASDYVNDGIPVINVRNIGYRSEKAADLEYLDDKTADRLKQHKLKMNDIVFGRKGAIDRHLIVKSRQTGWIQGSDCIRIRFNSKKICPNFLSYFFLTDGHKKWIEAQGAFGATMGSLNQGIIQRISYPLFPLPIQRKIAAVLSAYDDLIENNKHRIAILEKMAEELYREWFVRLRFPGHEKAKIDKGVPEGWEVKKIGELMEHQVGGGWGAEIPTGSENVPAYIIRGTDFKNIEKGNFSSTPLRFEKQSSVISRALQHGDIILENSVNAQSRCTGHTIIITQKTLDQYDHPVIPASFCKLLRFKDPNLSFYLWMHMKCLYDQGLMEYFQNVATNGIANFQIGRFLDRFEVKIPGDEFLYKIFWSFDTSNQKAILTKLQQSRDRFISRLMSGKIDVEHLDIEFPSSVKEETRAHA